MCRTACLLVLLTGVATAAPVPKEKPDPLPDGALVRLGSARFRGLNTDGVTFSKDGKLLYSTDDRATVFRWDAESGKPLEPIKLDVKDAYTSRVRGDSAFVVCNPDPEGPWRTRIVHVFDMPSGKKRSDFDTQGLVEFTNLSRGSEAGAISPDGKRFAVGSFYARKVLVFDTDIGKCMNATPPGNHEYRFAFSADGCWLVSHGQKDTTVTDLSGERRFPELPSRLSLAEFSPDGKKLAGRRWVPKEEGKPNEGVSRLGVWDLTTGKELATPNPSDVWQLAFPTPDALVIGATNASGTTVSRWDLRAGKHVWEAQVPFFVPPYEKSGMYSTLPGAIPPVMALSPDNTRLVVSDRFGRMSLFDTATGKRLDDERGEHPAEVRWVSLSSDGKTAVTASDHDIREWDAVTGELKRVLTPPEMSNARFVGATKDLLVWRQLRTPWKQPTTIYAWDRKQNKLAWKVTPEATWVWEVRPTDDSVVVGVAQKTGGVEAIQVYDAAGKLQREWDARECYRNAHPPGHSNDALWQYVEGKAGLTGHSLESGESVTTCQHEWVKGFSGLSLIAPSSDGKRIGIGGGAGDWFVVETAGGAILSRGTTTRIISAQPRNVVALPFSADGQKVLVHVNHHPVVQVAELKKDGKTWTLDGKGAAASAVAFSPDGKKAIVGYRDGTALIWDVSK